LANRPITPIFVLTALKLHPIPMNRFLPIVLLITLTSIWSCHFGKGNGTPKEFLNETNVDVAIYTKDKMTLNKQFENFLTTHDESFYSKEYFDSTMLIIDTILYSQDRNRTAVFVFTKNPTSRQPDPNKKDKWYYDGYCYLGKRQSDTFDLRWLNRFNLTNFHHQQLAVNRLRELYFTEFSTWKNTDETYRYGVNLDDKRFWKCKVWEEYFGH
jgi:hypothetical protein